MEGEKAFGSSDVRLFGCSWAKNRSIVRVFGSSVVHQEGTVLFIIGSLRTEAFTQASCPSSLRVSVVDVPYGISLRLCSETFRSVFNRADEIGFARPALSPRVAAGVRRELGLVDDVPAVVDEPVASQDRTGKA